MSIETLLIAAQYLDFKSQQEDAKNELCQDYSVDEMFESSPDSMCSLSPSPQLASSPTTSDSSFNGLFPKKSEKKRTNSGGQKVNTKKPESSRSVNREAHNRLEKHRRAMMKEGFEKLKALLPVSVSPRISNVTLLKEITNYIQYLKCQTLQMEDTGRNLQIQNLNLLYKRKELIENVEGSLKVKLTKSSNNEDSTTTASGKIECDEDEETSVAVPMPNMSTVPNTVEHATYKRPAVKDIMNSLRPSVLKSVKDEISCQSTEIKRSNSILYSHLTAGSAVKSEPCSSPTASCSTFSSLNSCQSAISPSPVRDLNESSVAESLLTLKSVQVTPDISGTCYWNTNTSDSSDICSSTLEDEAQLANCDTALHGHVHDRGNGVKRTLPMAETDVKKQCVDKPALSNLSETTNINESSMALLSSDFNSGELSCFNDSNYIDYVLGQQPIISESSVSTLPSEASSSVLVSSEASTSCSNSVAMVPSVKKDVPKELKDLPISGAKLEMNQTSSSTGAKIISSSSHNEFGNNNLPSSSIIIKTESDKDQTVNGKRIINLSKSMTHAGGNIVGPTCRLKSGDLLFNIPSNVMPSLQFVLSPVNGISSAPTPTENKEVNFNSSQVLTNIPNFQVNTFSGSGNCIKTVKCENGSGLRSVGSKLYFISLPDTANKIHTNGSV